MQRLRLTLLGVGLATIAALSASAGAATPASGHIGPKKPLLTWNTAQEYYSPYDLLIGFPYVSLTCPSAAADPQNLVCDHYTITVDVAESYWDKHHGGIAVTIPANFSGFIYTEDGRIAAADKWTGQIHTMKLLSPHGTYEVRLAPYFASGVSPVTARFVMAPGADGGFPRLGSDTERVGGYYSRTGETGAASANDGVAIIQIDGPPMRVYGR